MQWRESGALTYAMQTLITSVIARPVCNRSFDRFVSQEGGRRWSVVCMVLSLSGGARALEVSERAPGLGDSRERWAGPGCRVGIGSEHY
ncbi:hypothetical protein DFP72DRAFT_919388 [Ephemerocybe angulata]|uniref:Uncharacterized protein n=1 Tax=Ephemerocybe angulata TaxID=980116 RepID=A0A8H6LYM3_9AGAR|nr:hypothetical protein DFP72DRAFT_919388 [Tulosesus angulatus]